jgi:histidinol-phosphate/aromatic aminotransferase/cobyric acid decarboxylase-like protein/choline kinase
MANSVGAPTQAVILAAGMGRRLGELTRHSTKGMVRLGERPLLAHALDALIAGGIRRVVIVVGHGADELRAFVGPSWRGAEIVYVHNAAYAETNNIHSLLLAGEYLEAEDSLLLESDLVFDPGIVEDCIRAPQADVAVVAPFASWMDGTVVLLSPDGRIGRFVTKDEFDWSASARYAKTVNIYKFSSAFARRHLLPAARAHVEQRGRNDFYELVLKVLAENGAELLTALSVRQRLWYEIDDAQDLEIAEALFARDVDRLSHLQRRYGGYWRFPPLRDFCYLVNPFFPSRRLLEEMQHSLPQLLTQYPSGAAVQSRLAARMFPCVAECLAVGNGASELIRALAPEITGPVGVPVPTFEEYPSTFGSEVVLLSPRGEDFRHSPAELLQAVREHSLRALVLVNPDNPSGAFLDRDEVVALAEELHRSGVRLILDESFVDFVGDDRDHSCLDQATLERLPSLVLLKSLSKSYGIAGLRLGVLASADRELMARMVRRLPVWNINSLAEGFLQIAPKHAGDYRASCRRLADERRRFAASLQEQGVLHPLPSAANYLLCRVKGGSSAPELARRLAGEHWILVKDCTGKRGIPDEAYVRVAVRGPADNDALLATLSRRPEAQG